MKVTMNTTAKATIMTPETVAEIGKKDLFFLNKNVLGYKDVTERVHGEWQHFYQNSKKRLKLILVPREHFKTSFFTIGGTIQDLLINSSIRILIANATLGNAQSFLREIKEHAERNQRLRYYYPEVVDWVENSSKWTEKSIILPRTRVGKEPTIETTGVGGNLVSQHYDKIILDDLVNLDNVATRLQAEKVIDYFKYCLSLLEPEGQLLVIGTRWSYYELYQYILDELKEDFDVLIRNCWANKERTKPYFPEKFNQQFLEGLKRVQGGYIFSCQYENDPQDIEKAIFKKSDIQYYDKIPDILYITSTVDPNLSLSKTADYGAITTVGQDIKGNLYVLDIVREKMNPYMLINRLLMTYLKWKPKEIGFEANALQKTFQYFINEVLTRRKVHLPITPLRTKGIALSKELRIRALQPLFQNKKIFLKKGHPLTPILEDELLKFPLAKTDDVVDSLTSHLEITQRPDAPKELTEQTPITAQDKIFQEQREIAQQRPGIRMGNSDIIDDVLGSEF